MFHNWCRRSLLTILTSFQWLKCFISSRKIEKVCMPPSLGILKPATPLPRHRDLSCPLDQAEFTLKLTKLQFQDPSLAAFFPGLQRGPSTASWGPSAFLFKRAPIFMALQANASEQYRCHSWVPSRSLRLGSQAAHWTFLSFPPTAWHPSLLLLVWISGRSGFSE